VAFFYSSCCRKAPIHNNNQRVALWAVFCCLGWFWVAGWLCNHPQEVGRYMGTCCCFCVTPIPLFKEVTGLDVLCFHGKHGYAITNVFWCVFRVFGLFSGSVSIFLLFAQKLFKEILKARVERLHSLLSPLNLARASANPSIVPKTHDLSWVTPLPYLKRQAIDAQKRQYGPTPSIGFLQWLANRLQICWRWVFFWLLVGGVCFFGVVFEKC